MVYHKLQLAGHPLSLGINCSGYIALATGGAERMRITAAGNVGIGTTTPGALLDVAGAARATQFADRDNPAYYLDPAGATSLVAAGSVAIGDTDPLGNRLRIAGGPIRLEGPTTITNGLTVTAGGASIAGNLTLAGHTLFSPDNADDIGASGANRPRNLYLAGQARIGGTLFLDGSEFSWSPGSPLLTFASDTTFTIRHWDSVGATSRDVVKTSKGGLEVAYGNLVIAGSGVLRIGSNPALTGHVQLPNNGSIVGRNALNNGDIQMLKLTTQNIVDIIGEATAGVRVSNALTVTNGLTVSASGASITGSLTIFGGDLTVDDRDITARAFIGGSFQGNGSALDGVNAATLDGHGAGDFLDTSNTEQTKSGPLTLRGGALQVRRTYNFDAAVAVRRDSSDVQECMVINADSEIKWGSGAAPPDTSLYRPENTPNTLQTPGHFKVGDGIDDRDLTIRRGSLYAGNRKVADTAGCYYAD